MWSSAYEWASEAMSFSSDASAAPKTPSAPKPGPSTSMAEEALPILRRACERELPDAELLRFLRAKEWDVKRAAAAVRTTVAWRRERAEALRQPRFGPACLSRCVALMGNDGCAWPVYCLRPGQLQQAAIGRDVTTEQISAQAVAGYEALRRLLRVHQADATGLILLLDMRDVGMALLWAIGLRLVRDLVEVGLEHYPDLLRTLLIFSPVTEESYMLPQITALMRPLIAEATRTRVQVIRQDHELLPAIEEHIPGASLLGGPLGRHPVASRIVHLLGRRPARAALIARGLLSDDGARPNPNPHPNPHPQPHPNPHSHPHPHPHPYPHPNPTPSPDQVATPSQPRRWRGSRAYAPRYSPPRTPPAATSTSRPPSPRPP